MDKYIKKYRNILFVDIETTGLDPVKDRIIEVGAVKVDSDGNRSTYSKLINPGYKISSDVRRLTGIKLKELSVAPLFKDIADELLNLFKVDLFIAHNVKFDYEFLSEEFFRIDKDFPIAQIDTIKLAKTFYPNYLTYSLDSIIARMRLSVGKRHRGLDDALVLWELYQKIMIDFGEQALNKAIDKHVIPAKRRKLLEKSQVSLF